jgi:hypothetical protein
MNNVQDFYTPMARLVVDDIVVHGVTPKPGSHVVSIATNLGRFRDKRKASSECVDESIRSIDTISGDKGPNFFEVAFRLAGHAKALH